MRQHGRAQREQNVPGHFSQISRRESSPYPTYEYGPDDDEHMRGLMPMTEIVALQEFARQMPDIPPSDVYDAWLSMRKHQQNQYENPRTSQPAYGGRANGTTQTARWLEPDTSLMTSRMTGLRVTESLPKGGGGKDLLDLRGRWADRPRGSDFPPPPGNSGYHSPQLVQKAIPSYSPVTDPRQVTQGMIRSQEMREGTSTHPVGEVVSYLDVSPRATREFHGAAPHQRSTRPLQEDPHGQAYSSAPFDPNVSHLSTQSGGGYYDYGRVNASQNSDPRPRMSYDQSPPGTVGPSHPFQLVRPATKTRPTFHEDYEKKMQQRVRVKAAHQGHYTATKEAFTNPQRPRTAAPASRARADGRHPHSLHEDLYGYYPQEDGYYPQEEGDPRYDPRYQYNREPTYSYNEQQMDGRAPISSYAREAFYSKHEDPSLIGHPKNIIPPPASVDPSLSDAATDAGSRIRRMRVVEQEARKSMSARDLERARSNANGSHAVPGSPNVRLIGGQWKAVREEMKEGTPLWTDYYGPHGGSKEKVSYYGRQWKQDDKRVM